MKLQRHRPESGFTLLEVMLAVMLLAAVMTAIYFTWTAGLQGWKSGAEAADSLQKTRAILDGVGEMLRGAVYYDQSDEDEVNDALYALEGIHGTYGDNDADSVTFVTMSSRFLRPYEAERMPWRRVRFSLEQDEQRRPFLAMFSFNALGTEEDEPLPQKLSDDVIGFRVRYYDQDVDEWEEDWSDATSLPSQVEVTITYQLEGGAKHVVQQCVTPLPACDAVEQQQQARKQSKARARPPKVNPKK